MGYNISQVGGSIRIKVEKFEKALRAIKALMADKNKQIKDCSGYHFSWIDTKEVLAAKNLPHALRVWRWEPTLDENGDIVGLLFNCEKLGDDKLLFDTIAPFVEGGSFIEMEGEDGSKWKWKFFNRECQEIAGHTVYEDEE